MRPIFNLLLVLTILFTASCNYDFPDVVVNEDVVDSAELRDFVVIGGTFASGYMNGAFYRDAHLSAFPSLIGDKLNAIYNETVFTQATSENENGFNVIETNGVGTAGQYALRYLAFDDPLAARITLEGEALQPWQGNAQNLSDFSIPFLKSADIDDRAALDNNPFFERLNLSDGMSILDAVIARDPKVVLLNLGIDEVFHPAIFGGTIPGDNRPLSELAPDLATFQQQMTEIVNRILNETSAEVFVTNVPSFIRLPLFNARGISFALGREITGANIAAFNSFYAEFNSNVLEYNQGKTGSQLRPIIDFDVDGGERFRARVVEDPTLPDAVLNDGTVIPKLRQLRENEFLLYSADPKTRESTDFGSFEPVPTKYVLLSNQISLLNNRVNAYNQVFDILANSNNRVHLVDLYNTFEQVGQEQMLFENVTLNSRFARYSIISSDGFTPNPRGQALIANRIINRINAVLDVDIQPFNINDFPGLQFENDF